MGDWTIAIEGLDREDEPGAEARLALANGTIGARAGREEGGEGTDASTFLAGLFDGPWAASELPGERSQSPSRVSGVDPWGAVVEVAGAPVDPAVGRLIEHAWTLDLRRAVLHRRWRQRQPSGQVVVVETDRRLLLDRPPVALHVLRITVEGADAAVRLTLRLDFSRAVQAGELSPVEVLADDCPSGLLMVGAALPRQATSGAPPLRLVVAQSVNAGPGAAWHRTGRPSESAAGCALEWKGEAGRAVTIERRLALAASRDVYPGARPAQALQAIERCSTAELIASHEAAWSARWQRAEIEIDGAPALTRALRFAVYHLIASGGDPEGAHAATPRGLAVQDDRGHVPWDLDVHQLPFFLFTAPEVARSMVLHRHRTLDAARGRARALGFRGALYARESAGAETAPEEGRGAGGRRVSRPAATCAPHVSADVAHAVWTYWRATGDDRFFAEAGVEILVETARFWASRVSVDRDGSGHILGVVGPDEYHPGVDDDAYTNEMARRNLRLGAAAAGWWRRFGHAAARWSAGPEEPARWRALADGLASPRARPDQPAQQFRGYFQLEDLRPAHFGVDGKALARRVGRDRLARTQIIEQPDVLLLALLLPEAADPAATARDFAVYDPRCAHGTSLSPAVHAAVAFRVGEGERGLALLDRALAPDVGHDLRRSASGVHLGAFGAAWQAVTFGAGGLAPGDDHVGIDPRLPGGWERMRCAVCWRGRALRLELAPSQVEVELIADESPAPLLAAGADRPPTALRQGERLRLRPPVRLTEGSRA
jgi:trehalose/maltose hydrolase-like predicted phosphorylase